MSYNVYKDWYENPKLIDKFTEFMLDHGILNWSRIGGIDYEIAMHYYYNPGYFDSGTNHAYWLDCAKKFPGYFDFGNKKDNFLLYAKKLITYFENVDGCCYAGADLIDKIDNAKYTSEDKKFLDHILDGKNIIHYSFIESVLPFLHSFKSWGEGKKILVVSPLSKSIEFQYARRDKIIKNYTWPNFELLTLNTALTWQTPTDTKESLHIETNNWHEECDRLTREIDKINFDVAWLSCGSYATFLGNYLKVIKKKKSVYIGGILGCLFGIRGGRYLNSYFSQFTDDAYKITPLENEFVKSLNGGKSTKMESARAYFIV